MLEKDTEYEFSKAYQEDDEELPPLGVEPVKTVTFEEFFAGFEDRYSEDEFFLMKWCFWLGIKLGRNE